MASSKFTTVETIAEKWGVSERSVRNYCTQGRVPGAILEGKTWKIPADAKKPKRQSRHSTKPETLLQALVREKEAKLKGGIYNTIQIELTYNSNHIEGSALSHDQTRFIFETSTFGATNGAVRIDDIIETANHFTCVDLVIDGAKSKLTEGFIKQLHRLLKTGTSDSQKAWFQVGDYKLLENQVGGYDTTSPQQVPTQMKALLSDYNSKKNISFKDILDFHVRFESIHPFQDGNGRVGRLIILKECLKHDIVPFIITDELKQFYYRGLQKWATIPEYLTDTCLTAQDQMKQALDYFGIRYC